MLFKKKNNIIWEEPNEQKKEDSKLKKRIKKILSIISKYSGLIESILIILLSISIKNDIKYWILFLGFGIWRLWRYIKNLWIIKKSKLQIIYESKNKRATGNEGAQGAGKTSLMCLIASILNVPVFSSAPIKINGKMSYILTKEILNMYERIPLGSLIIIDEISFYWDNDMSKLVDHAKTQGLEITLQLIRHLFDGYFMSASVDMNRVAKRIEEKHSMFRRLLGQDGLNTSLIIDPIINIISNIFNLDIKTGIRCWTYQTFENIDHKGYIFDLSRQEKNVDNKRFANLVEIRAWNSNINFEYDDRYFKELYLKLPKAELKEWPSLKFNYEQLKETGFENIIKIFKDRYEKLGIDIDKKVGD